jgi:hypothetical protein
MPSLPSSRRTAAAAAVVAVIAAVGAPAAHAATTAPAVPAGAQLYVATAAGGTLTRAKDSGTYRLTLRAPSSRITAFADHPGRGSISEPVQRFVSGWGKAGLAADPPNAALVIDRAPADRDVTILELSKPRVARSGTLTFEARPSSADGDSDLASFVKRADRHVNRHFGRVSLFVDAGVAPTAPVTISVNVPAWSNLDLAFDTPKLTLDNGPLNWSASAQGALTVGNSSIAVATPASPVNGQLIAYAPKGSTLTGVATLPDGATASVRLGSGATTQIANGRFSIPVD